MIYTGFLFISGTEITFILFIVILVFGADKIPGIAKGLGKGMRTPRASLKCTAAKYGTVHLEEEILWTEIS